MDDVAVSRQLQQRCGNFPNDVRIWRKQHCGVNRRDGMYIDSHAKGFRTQDVVTREWSTLIRILVRTVVLAFVACAGMHSVALATTIRVNAGGSAYMDSSGNVWSADYGYNSGSLYSISLPLSGTSDPSLYAVGRYDTSTAAPTLLYAFTVPNGNYDVRLHFAEPAIVAGGRQFNVEIEGSRVFTNLDVTAEAGAVRVALIKSFTARVADGQLNLAFLHGAVNNPFIAAIEILSTAAPSTPITLSVVPKSATQLNLSWPASVGDYGVAGYRVERCQGVDCANFVEIAQATGTNYSDSGLSPLTTYRYRARAVNSNGDLSAYTVAVSASTYAAGYDTIRINAGGSTYTDTAGHVWSADTGFSGGTVYSSSPSIAGTSDDPLYSIGRYDSSSSPPILQYSFAVPNGSYELHLLFAEPSIPAGQRRFNVNVEGSQVFTNLDVAAEAGILTALTKTATVAVADGYLDIQFLHGAANNPFIDAIEVVQISAPDAQAPSSPLGVAATAYSSSRIDVTWNPASDNVGVLGYILERCQGAGCTAFSDIATPTGTAFSDTGLVPGVTYRYRVRARDAAGNVSSYSGVAFATTLAGGGGTQVPTAPASLTATPGSVIRVDLAWAASTDDLGVAGYLIERCFGIACSSFSSLAAVSSVTAYADTSVVAGVTYRYRVRARDADNNYGEYSPIATATTPVATGTAGSTTYQYDSFGRLKQVTVVPH